MIRIVVVDDEALARERVRQLAGKIADLEFVGECEDGEMALRVVREQRPDLLLLDVQMPKLDGFQMLERLPSECMPVVIFTTAFDQHAVRAFDTHAVDYLMKPLQTDRFARAIEKVRGRLATQAHQVQVQDILALLADKTPLSTANKYLTRITIRGDDEVLVVRTADIEAFETAGNYIVAHAGPVSHVIRDNLSALESQLDPQRFLRVSRSALVNLDHVRAVQPLFKGEHAILLQNGKKITLTRGVREIERALRFS
jgi:two-component system, LytTR family, response regulator